MQLSIITINFNNAAGLKKTIESVIAQTFTDFEYIVIDGASTDGSVALIKNHQTKITYWQSQKDKGIYQALNQGIKKAQGEYCLFLNAGDCLSSPFSLSQVFAHSNGADILYGDAKFIIDQQLFYIIKYPSTIDEKFLLNDNLCHQTSFIKRRLFTQYGLYDESFQISSDWLFFLQTLLIHHCSAQHLPFVVSDYDLHGMSSTRTELVNQERETILKQVFSKEKLKFYRQHYISSQYKFRIRLIDRVRNKSIKLMRQIIKVK